MTKCIQFIFQRIQFYIIFDHSKSYLTSQLLWNGQNKTIMQEQEAQKSSF